MIDTIGTDHSPAPPELKHLDTGDVFRAWGGIASLQLALPAVWTEARRRGFTLADLAGWMALHPADLVGLSGRKGAIAPGRDADLVVFDPDTTFTVDPTALYHRHRATPYEGRVLDGHVEATYLRGRAVYRVQQFRPGRHRGKRCWRRAQSRQEPFHEPGTDQRLDRRIEARESFTRCCGSSALVRGDGTRPGRLNPRRPCSKPPSESGGDSSKADWLEAFAAHPRIGDMDALRAKFAATAAWASREQAGVDGAVGRRAHRNLAMGNRQYEERFGYIFIVCATGKTAEEMLELLTQRLSNDPEAEIKLAAGEQMKITRIRLERIAP